MTIPRAYLSTRYDRVTIHLHWIVAIAVAFQWLGANSIDWFPKGPLRVDARSVHIVVGAGLLIVLMFRLYWRTFRGLKLKTQPSISAWLAKLVHASLYISLFAVICVGIFNTWLRGDDLFGLGHIPKFGTYTDPVRHLFANHVVNLHRLLANTVLILAGLHASVALLHHFIIKDEVLKRMIHLPENWNQ